MISVRRLFTCICNYVCLFIYVITPSDLREFCEEPHITDIYDQMVRDHFNAMLNFLYWIFIYVMNKIIKIMEYISDIHTFTKYEYYS